MGTQLQKSSEVLRKRSAKDGSVKELLERLEGFPPEDVVTLWLDHRRKKISRRKWGMLWVSFFPETTLSEQVIARYWKIALREYIANHREKFISLLEGSGLGLEKVIDKLKELTEAKKHEFFRGKMVLDGEGNPVETPDNTIRARALERLIELHRITEKKDGVSNQVLIMINAAPIEKPGNSGR